MSYGRTMLEDLPDIDAVIENDMPEHGLSQQARTKYIRPSHSMVQESGMAAMNPPQPQAIPQPYHPSEEQMMQQGAPAVRSYSGIDPMSLNCVDVSHHIQACPICSKFYANDKTIYFIIILILGFTCLLLLKKVLNV